MHSASSSAGAEREDPLTPQIRPAGRAPRLLIRPRPERGNAIVEFIGIVAVVIVPAVFLLTALAVVTNAQLALAEAARQAAREYVRADSVAHAQIAAEQAALSAWNNPADELELSISCSANPCLSPGASITVTVRSRVQVPLVGDIAVAGSQTMPVDRYRSERP